MSVASVTSAKHRTLDMVCPINWQHPLNRGLLGRWQCIPGLMGGSRLVNLCRLGDKDGLHGTLTNGPTWQGALGRPGGSGSLSFDGTDDSIALPDTGITTNEATFVCWFNYTTKDSYEGLFGVRHDVTKFAGLSFSGAAGNPITCRWDDNTNEYDAATGLFPTADRWHFAAGVVTASETRVFLDSAKSVIAESNSSYTLNAGTGSGWFIGYDGVLSRYFHGSIDDCRFYRRALSDAEISALYADSLRGSPETLNWIRPVTVFDMAAGGGGAVIPPLPLRAGMHALSGGIA